MVDHKTAEPFGTTSRWQAAGGLLGLPWPTSVEDQQEILTKAAERKKSALRRAQNTVRLGDG